MQCLRVKCTSEKGRMREREGGMERMGKEGRGRERQRKEWDRGREWREGGVEGGRRRERRRVHRKEGRER